MMIGYSAGMTILPVVLSSLILEFSLSSSQEGMMSSFISLGALSALLGSTYLQGRVRKALIITLAGIVASVILATMGVSRNFSLLLVCFFLQGFFLCGLLDAFINAFIVDLNPKDSGRYVSFLHACFGAGGLIAPLVFQQAVQYAGWQGVYLLAAALLFVLTLPFTITGIKAGRESVPVVKKDSKLTLEAIKEFFSNKRNLILLICMFFYCTTQNTHVLWLIRYMTVVLDNPGYGAIALSGFWVCCTICRFVMPHMPGKPIFKFALGMLPAAVFLGFGLLSGSAMVMIIVSCLFGLFGGHSIPTLINECARQYRGATTFPSMIMILSMHVAGMIMPVLMGITSGRFSLQNAMLLLPLLALFASLSGFIFLIHQRGKD
jgi:fucose permease